MGKGEEGVESNLPVATPLLHSNTTTLAFFGMALLNDGPSISSATVASDSMPTSIVTDAMLFRDRDMPVTTAEQYLPSLVVRTRVRLSDAKPGTMM